MTSKELTVWITENVKGINPDIEGEFFSSTTILQSGHLDSMQFVELLARIHREFDIVVDFGEIDDFDHVLTVGGLADYAASLINGS